MSKPLYSPRCGEAPLRLVNLLPLSTIRLRSGLFDLHTRELHHPSMHRRLFWVGRRRHPSTRCDGHERQAQKEQHVFNPGLRDRLQRIMVDVVSLPPCARSLRNCLCPRRCKREFDDQLHTCGLRLCDHGAQYSMLVLRYAS